MHPAWLLIPLAVGLAQPIILQMNVRLARASGDMEAAVVLHLVGFAVGIGWMTAGVRGAGFTEVASVPWWAWLGGAIGVTGMAAVNKAIPQIGVASAIAIMVAAQLVAALVFEHNGWLGAVQRQLSAGRLVGAVLLAGGAWLVTR